MRNLETRLKRLEMTAKGKHPEVLQWIREGRFYDELTTEEQEQFSQYYYGFSAKSLKEILPIFDKNPFHFQLERKPKPPTKEELAKRAEELERIFGKMKSSEENSTKTDG